MLVTPLGMVILEMVVLFRNALAPMVVTGRLSMAAGMLTAAPAPV